MKLKINTDLYNLKEGAVVTIQTKDGIPTEKYWRDRLKDSEIDGCVSVIKKTKRITRKEESKDDDTSKS